MCSCLSSYSTFYITRTPVEFYIRRDLLLSFDLFYASIPLRAIDHCKDVIVSLPHFSLTRIAVLWFTTMATIHLWWAKWPQINLVNRHIPSRHKYMANEFEFGGGRHSVAHEKFFVAMVHIPEGRRPLTDLIYIIQLNCSFPPAQKKKVDKLFGAFNYNGSTVEI